MRIETEHMSSETVFMQIETKLMTHETGYIYQTKLNVNQ